MSQSSTQRSLLLFAALLALGGGAKAQPAEPADLTEPAGEWRQLFNGQNLDGWVAKLCHHELGDNYADTYRVEEGVLQVRYDKYNGFGERFGHLFYDEPFSRYHLAVEYRFAGEFLDGAPGYARLNSGVMLHSQDPRTILVDQTWPISVELQFLARLPGGGPRATGNVCTPGTHVRYNGRLTEDHIIGSSAPTFAPDEWVRAEAIVRGDGTITHLINGQKVLEYSSPEIGGGVVSGHDPAAFEEGKPLGEGYIALQSEGHPIDFRKVEIRELTNDE